MWKFDEISEDHRKLLSKGIIDIGGDVKGDMALYVRQALQSLVASGAVDIAVVITSDGGSVETGLDIYDMIRLYPGKVTGRVIGYAQSIASVILQACDTRECTRHGRILIHNINRERIPLDSLRNPKKMEKILQDMERGQHYINRILADRTGQSLNAIRKACKLGEEWTAIQALRFGLIDKIV